MTLANFTYNIATARTINMPHACFKADQRGGQSALKPRLVTSTIGDALAQGAVQGHERSTIDGQDVEGVALLGLHIARHSQAPFMRKDGNAAKRSSGLENPARSVRDECIGGRSREDESVQSILEAEEREPRLRGSEGRSNSVYCAQWDAQTEGFNVGL